MKKEIYCSNEDISNMILDYQNGKTVKYISEKPTEQTNAADDSTILKKPSLYMDSHHIVGWGWD